MQTWAWATRRSKLFRPTRLMEGLIPQWKLATALLQRLSFRCHLGTGGRRTLALELADG